MGDDVIGDSVHPRDARRAFLGMPESGWRRWLMMALMVFVSVTLVRGGGGASAKAERLAGPG